MELYEENSIEFLNYDKNVVGTFGQRAWVTKMKKLAESHPDEVVIIAENPDGSLCVRFPVSYLKISPKKFVSEERRQQMSEVAKKRGFKKIVSDSDTITE